MSSISDNIYAQMTVSCVSDKSECWCRGSGWVLTDWDSWHQCPCHYDGQPDPEDCDQASWDYYWDTLNGDGQFVVIPKDDDQMHPFPRMRGGHVDGTRLETAWAWMAFRSENQYDDIPF